MKGPEGKKSKTMYNLKQKSKFRIFMAETKRGTVKESKQKSREKTIV